MIRKKEEEYAQLQVLHFCLQIIDFAPQLLDNENNVRIAQWNDVITDSWKSFRF